MSAEEIFSRELTLLEKALLLWVLPSDKPGYAAYRKLVQDWKVVGRSRSGAGGVILAPSGKVPDLDSPPAPLFAFGLVKSGTGEISVSVLERMGDQLEFEISGPVETVLPQGIESYRRWTLSEWLPSLPCPGCGEAPREVEMKTESGHELVLAICAKDHRLWLHDTRSRVNHPIPVTGFYNELMLQLKTPDRRKVPDAKQFFTDLGTYSDAALTGAFSSYNRLRTKVFLGEPLIVPTEGSLNWFRRAALRLFGRGK